MQLKEFAEQHRLRVRRSRQDDTDNVVGKFGEIYEYCEDKLGVIVIPVPLRRGLWVRSRAPSSWLSAWPWYRTETKKEQPRSIQPTLYHAILLRNHAANLVQLSRSWPARKLIRMPKPQER